MSAERGTGGNISRTSSVSLGALVLFEATLDFTDLKRVSLVVFRMRFVAANLRIFLALPIFAVKLLFSLSRQTLEK